VPLVEPAGVAIAEVLHQARERELADLHHEVHVVGHEAEGVDATSESLHALLEQRRVAAAVVIVEKGILARDAALDHVVDSPGEVDAWFACHRGRLAT